MPPLSVTEVAFLMLACQQAVLTGGWLVGAALLPQSRLALLYWAGHAALGSVAVVVLVVPIEPFGFALRVVGNVAAVFSMIALQRGVWCFFGRPSPWLWHGVLSLTVVAGAAYGMDSGNAAWRVIAISGGLAVLCLWTAWDIQANARRRIELRWSAVLAVPVLLAGIVFIVRGGRALLAPADMASVVTAGGSVNIPPAVLFMVVALAFQLTLVALVVSRLISDLRRASRYDSQTGLLNRRAIEEALEAEVNRARRSGEPFSVLMLDADHFKAINDRDGHAAGDRALQHLGTLLAAHMREIDLVGRYGGEEFVVILPGTSQADARVLAERLREKVEALPVRWQDHTMPLTVSIGVAQWRGDAEDRLKLLSRADAALYQAKDAGRNRVVADWSEGPVLALAATPGAS